MSETPGSKCFINVTRAFLIHITTLYFPSLFQTTTKQVIYFNVTRTAVTTAVRFNHRPLRKLTERSSWYEQASRAGHVISTSVGNSIFVATTRGMCLWIGSLSSPVCARAHANTGRTLWKNMWPWSASIFRPEVEFAVWVQPPLNHTRQLCSYEWNKPAVS